MAFRKILIVGFGTMARAMVDGWLAAGVPADRFAVYHPRGTHAPQGIVVHTEWPTSTFDAVLIAVKPQMLEDISAGLEPLAGPDTVVISVLGGVELASLAQRFPRAGGVVRLMPNLAVALGKSPNALIAQGLDGAQVAALTELAVALGTAEWVESEGQFDLVTALAGSGPAFVYRFIDALAAGAADLGLDRVQADRLALAMVEGATALASAADCSPGELARQVASPGGMTQKGLDELDNDAALQSLLTRCLRATRDQGIKLARAVREQG